MFQGQCFMGMIGSISGWPEYKSTFPDYREFAVQYFQRGGGGPLNRGS